jgi:uncharacterized membrane protein YjgN (DUF898 family)
MSDALPTSANQPENTDTGSEPPVTPAPPAAAATLSALPETAHRFVFSGTGGEYFGIWIVNIVLSILTLGIYSAWAKVRRLQYFHRHTQVAESSFDFHARPIDILKGRALAFGAYLAFVLLSKVSVTLSIVLALMLFAVIPYFAYKSLRFRFRNSSWRQIRFNFRGKVPGAYGAFLGWPLAALATMYTLLPLSHHQITAYGRGNAGLGATPASFQAKVWDFYKIYFKTAGLFVLLLVVVAVPAWFALSSSSIPWKSMMQSATTQSLQAAASGPNTSQKASPATTTTSQKASPATTTQTEDEEQSADDEPRIPGFPGGSAEVFAYLPLLFFAFYLLAFLAIGPYFSARINNVIWNGTRLGPMRFESVLSARRLSFITITNWLAIIVTLGFFKPFAAVRMAKYRAQSLSLIAAGPIAVHAQVAAGNVNARGEEIAEMFDVDIGM